MTAPKRCRWTLMLAPLLWAAISCGDDTNDPALSDTDYASGDTDAGQNLSGITPRFDPEGDGFYSMPWPSDSRIDESGMVDLSGFPEADNPFIGLYLDVLTEFVHGFSTMPVVYVGFDGAPSTDRHLVT